MFNPSVNKVGIWMPEANAASRIGSRSQLTYSSKHLSVNSPTQTASSARRTLPFLDRRARKVAGPPGSRGPNVLYRIVMGRLLSAATEKAVIGLQAECEAQTSATCM